MLDSVSRSRSNTAVGKRTSVRIARTFNDLMTVTAIRSAVYLAEQDCPIEEEFDGNDFVAAHFLNEAFRVVLPDEHLQRIAEREVRREGVIDDGVDDHGGDDDGRALGCRDGTCLMSGRSVGAGVR